MKYYLFLDESGDHSLINIDLEFPVFVLCGVLIDEMSYKNIQREIKQIKEFFWVGKKVLFHSRDIRKCDKEFQILFDLKIKEEFYKRINNLITNNEFIIVASAINKIKFIRKYGKLAQNIYEISLSFIIERTIFALDDSKSQNEPLHIIIERRGKNEDNKLKDYFNKLLQRGTGYVDRKRLEKHLIHFEFFDKQANIEGLQIADLLAYPISRYIIDKERANPAFEILSSKFYKKRERLYGLKEYP